MKHSLSLYFICFLFFFQYQLLLSPSSSNASDVLNYIESQSHHPVFKKHAVFQLSVNSLCSCFNIHKASFMKKYYPTWLWKNLSSLHRFLTSNPFNIFGMNWNAHCEPGYISRHQCWNLSNALMSECSQALNSG